MKTVINFFVDVLMSIGQARAAAQLARDGYHEEAKRLALKD